MTRKQIADKSDVSTMTVWNVINNKCKTTNLTLARLISNETGLPPADYISESVKELALKIHPELSKKCAVHAKRVSDKA